MAWLTLVCLGYNVYRAVFLNQLFGSLAIAIESRLSGLEEQLSGIFAELDGKGVDVVQLFFCKGICGHSECYRECACRNALGMLYFLALQAT
jgi:hypothetical protein